MVAVNVELLASVLSILAILVGAIFFMVRIANKVTIALNNVNNSLELQTEEIAELKGYRKDIDKNREDIQELKLTTVHEDEFNRHLKDFNTLQTQHKMHHGGVK